ncbi:MAG: ATP-binding protein [Actinomycetota bacterium]
MVPPGRGWRSSAVKRSALALGARRYAGLPERGVMDPLPRFGRARAPAKGFTSEPGPQGAFVGRVREVSELLAGLEHAISGHGRLTLVSGEPGIGKSRLADEFASHARELGARVLWGRCWEAGGAPAYWPWVQVLRTYLRSQDSGTIRELMGSGAADIAQMLPEINDLFPEIPPPPSLDPESARFRLFDSTAMFLRSVAAAESLVLLIEDIHAADTPSLLLLRFLATQLQDSRLLVVATYRDVELTPESSLTATVSELRREPSTHHLAMGGLAENEVALFVEAAAGLTPAVALVSALRRGTHGNPLFLNEAVRLLRAEGRLRELGDVASLRLGVPQAIRDVIARRVVHLTEASREALSIASVLGSEFSPETLARVADRPPEDALEILGEAVTAGLLAEVAGPAGRFRFSHDLIRETLYKGLTPAGRTGLHRRAAEVLEELYGEEADRHLAELARHFSESATPGQSERAVDYALRAGEAAARSLAYEEAVRLFRMALQALELDERADERLLAETLLRLGDTQSRSGDFVGAKEWFLRAAGVAGRTGDPRHLARAALGYGGRFVWARAGNDAHLVPLLQDALVLLGGQDARLRVRLLTRLACTLRSSPDQERIAALSRQAVDIARTLNDPSTLGYALAGATWAIWGPGNPEERIEITEELLRVAGQADDGELLADGHVARYAALAELGAMTKARAELEAFLRTAQRLRQPAHQWVASAVVTQLALMEGAFDRAEALIDEELVTAEEANPGLDNISGARFQLFLLRREQGRAQEVEETIRDTMDDLPWYPLHRGALALLLLDASREAEARDVFEELAEDEFHALHRDNEWMLGIALASEVCAGLSEANAAGTLYDMLIPFARRHAIGQPEGSVGAVDRYLGLLATTRSRFDEAQRHFEEGLLMNERMGGRTWVAHTEHDYAGMLLVRDGPGDRERALTLLGSCLQNCRELGMVALEGKATALLAELGEAHAPHPVPFGRAASRPGVFRREGEYFSVAFEGGAFRLKDAKGLRYLGVLLASPGKEFHVLDLVASEGGMRGPTPGAGADELPLSGLGDAGEILDARAKDAYRRRLIELEEEMSEAEALGDSERAARANGEREFLVRELASAVGIGGRNRVGASASERARVNVTRAIRSSMARLAEHDPALGRHLDATLRTGTFCSYTPDPRAPLSWQL